MTNLGFINCLMEILPGEVGLVRQAKSGCINAFVELYESYMERIYRYVYFFAPNTRTAQVLASKVFFKVWENLGHYSAFDSSFAVWLYSIARDQVIAPYVASGKNSAPDTDFVLAARGGDLREDFQIIRVGLRGLTPEQRHVLISKFILGLSDGEIACVIRRRVSDVYSLKMQGLLELTGQLRELQFKSDEKGLQQILEKCLAGLSSGTCTLKECEAHYPDCAAQLIPLLETALLLEAGRDVYPLVNFRENTHDMLIQYAQSRPQRRQTVMPMLQRTALTLSVLTMFFLVTGTAHAQSALPGNAFYGWKRTSEQVWRALSSDPVATDIILVERRRNEWIAVADDPAYSAVARSDYLEMLNRLEAASDVETFARVVSVLQSEQQILNVAGLPAPELDDYLEAVAGVTPVDSLLQITSTSVLLTETKVVATVVPVDMETLTMAAPTATEFPTATVPTATETPIAIVPTATETPTEITPTETDLPTEIALTETETPTEIAPTETETPTEIVPTETETPTKVVPIETEIPTKVVQNETPTPSEITPTSDAPLGNP